MKRWYITYRKGGALLTRYIYAPSRDTAIMQASIYGIKNSAIKHCIQV